MTPEQQLQDKIQADQPKAGQNKQWFGNNLLFLSPLPSKIAQPALDWNGSFTEVNETYLQLGGFTSRRTFQVQAANIVLFGIICILYIFPFIVFTLRYFINPDNGSDSLLSGAWEWISGSLSITIPCFLLIFCVNYGTIVYTLITQKNQSPLYFNRQRREVLYTAKGATSPIIQSWEQTIVWLGQQANFTGTAVIQHGFLGFLLQDKDDQTRIGHIVLQSPDTNLVLPQWAGIYNYMEQGVSACPEATSGKPETLSTKRKRLHQKYKAGEHGLAFMIGWYLWHIFTLWSQPYWIAAFEYKYLDAYKPNENTRQWLAPLPEAQWTKPSSEFLAYQAKVEEAILQNKSFIDVANENNQNQTTHEI